MNEVQRHPIDYDKLEKGDIIPSAKIEEIAKVKKDSKQYAFKMLKIKGQIEHELAERGKVWTLSCVNGDLKILTDAEAATYNYVESRHARRKEKRCFLRKGAVDISNLPDEQRPVHERELEIQGRYIQAQNSVRAGLRLESTKRTVPGLPSN